MPPHTRIPSQPRDSSPAYTSPIAYPNGPSNVRRNLFSAHLSRRPASSQSQPQSQSQLEPELASPSSQPNPLSSHPHLQPTQVPLTDMYDPTISPNHPLSPSSSATLFPSSSIIALHPVTGRPILPNLPTLPGRLRLSDDDEDDADHDNDDNEHDNLTHHDDEDHDPSQGHHPHSHGADFSTVDALLTNPSRYASPSAAGYVDEADDERRDRERIERLLSEMMSRQRIRAKSKEPTVRPKRSAGRARDSEDAAAEKEKEELMGLMMASLRREVGRADEEGWMFGDAAGLGGANMGRDELGVYD